MELKNKINGSVIDVPADHAAMLVRQGSWEEVKVVIEKNVDVEVISLPKQKGRPKK